MKVSYHTCTMDPSTRQVFVQWITTWLQLLFDHHDALIKLLENPYNGVWRVINTPSDLVSIQPLKLIYILDLVGFTCFIGNTTFRTNRINHPIPRCYIPCDPRQSSIHACRILWGEQLPESKPPILSLLIPIGYLFSRLSCGVSIEFLCKCILCFWWIKNTSHMYYV